MTAASMPETFVEQAEYEKGFSPYYQQHITPLLENLEQDRKKALKQFIIASVAGIIFVAFVYLFLHSTLGSFDHWGKGTGKFFCFCIVLASAYPVVIYQQYSHEAKEVLLPPLVKFFGDLNYTLYGMQESLLVSFSIMPPHNTYTSEDHINGAFDKVLFNLSQIKLVSGYGRNQTVTFEGTANILQMNKPFKGRTILKSKTTLFSGWDNDHKKGLEAVTLEDTNFNKKFDIYSSDQVEARYILTPTFMERITELAVLMHHWGSDPSHIKNSTALGNISCGFNNDSLLLMISCSKDLFAPGNIFTPAYHTNAIRCVLYQIYLIRCIVETLKLNQHIGM
jgi:hypothetical protein